MSNLIDFLTDLATNIEQQEAFEENAEEVINTTFLTENDKAVLSSRDKTAITMALSDESFQSAYAIFDPAPDPLPNPDPLPEPEG